ncbi:MAG TPA: hypothetical protein VHA55_05080 [Pseudorhodoplanes sp.]|jgi:hypothetical protein|nr:hypothetical protein [Pseudorhodoplanes sp.]
MPERRHCILGALTLAAVLAAVPFPSAGAEPAAEGKAPPGASAKAKVAKKKPRIVVRRSSGYGPYGFLPGYTPPDTSDRRPRKTYHYWRGYDWYGYPVGSWGTGGYGGMWYRGRFSNGLGPCWSRTPIGPMWNCG